MNRYRVRMVRVDDKLLDCRVIYIFLGGIDTYFFLKQPYASATLHNSYA